MNTPNPSENDEKATLRAEVIRRLEEEAKISLSPSEMREQMASYIESEMKDCPRKRIDEFLNKNYGETST